MRFRQWLSEEDQNAEPDHVWKTTPELAQKMMQGYKQFYPNANLQYIPVNKIHLHIDYRKSHNSEGDRKGGRKYVRELAKAMQSGPLPPAVGNLRPDGYYHMDDGHHRVSAAKMLKQKFIPMMVSNHDRQYREQFEGNIQTLVAYHQTDPDAAKKIKRYGFNLKQALQPIVWFTTNLEALQQNSIGARGKGAILQVEVRFTKPAGWDEYKKLTLGQIRNDGYDVVLLPKGDTLDGFVFNPKQIKILGIV
jgi:hypothetical protein